MTRKEKKNGVKVFVEEEEEKEEEEEEEEEKEEEKEQGPYQESRRFKVEGRREGYVVPRVAVIIGTKGRWSVGGKAWVPPCLPSYLQ